MSFTMKRDIFQFQFLVTATSGGNFCHLADIEEVPGGNQEATCKASHREGEGEYLMGRRVLSVDQDNRL